MTTVSEIDLEDAIDWLQGLEMILAAFRDAAPGEDVRPSLIEPLQSMVPGGPTWQALRYEVGVGQGWEFVTGNVATLRDRLKAAMNDDR